MVRTFYPFALSLSMGPSLARTLFPFALSLPALSLSKGRRALHGADLEPDQDR